MKATWKVALGITVIAALASSASADCNKRNRNWARGNRYGQQCRQVVRPIYNNYGYNRPCPTPVYYQQPVYHQPVYQRPVYQVPAYQAPQYYPGYQGGLNISPYGVQVQYSQPIRCR